MSLVLFLLFSLYFLSHVNISKDMKPFKKYKYTKKGGKPIDSGSYGCVFKPALKCKGKTRKKGVSKLMLKHNALSELQLLAPIYKIMTKYPEVKNHILVPSIKDICVPDSLTTSDLKSFDSVCNNLYSKGYNILTINSKLNTLRLLHMEDGGITLDEYIQHLTKDHVYHVLKGLYDIYKKVIIPINNNGFFHSDIKDNNILVKNDTLKIIDFGLMIQHDSTAIHSRFLQHSFHHLTPFSVLLFHEDVPFHWEHFFKIAHNLPKEEFIEKCTYHIKNAYLVFKKKNTESSREKYGQEHIKEICAILFPNQDYLYIISKELAYCYYFFKSQQGTFDIANYYNSVFIYLTDIWGLCSILFYLLDKLMSINYNSTVIQMIKNIIKKYMFGMRHYPFQLRESFEKDLRDLTNTFKKSSSRKSSSRKSSSRKSSSRKISSRKSSNRKSSSRKSSNRKPSKK